MQGIAGTIDAGELYRRVNRGEIPEILDLRNRDESATSPIVGRRPVAVRNVPVYAVMDELDAEAERVQDGAIVICGQGHGSALVVEELRSRGRETLSLEGGADSWSRLLVPVEIPVPGTELRVWQFQRPSKGCLSYVVGVPGGRCLVVDPARDPVPYVRLARQHVMSVTHVVETHVHADHITGGPRLAADLGVEYLVPPADVGSSSPYANGSLRDGQELDLGAATVRILALHVPGHTPGSVAVLIGESLALTGDTVFVRGVGRPDLTGHAEELAHELFHSLHERLGLLDPETMLAPAHWSSAEEFDAAGIVGTTIGEAFASDLLADQPVAEFVATVVSTLPVQPDSYDTIRRVNSGTLLLPEADLDLLDVGMNQCAAGGTRPGD